MPCRSSTRTTDRLRRAACVLIRRRPTRLWVVAAAHAFQCDVYRIGGRYPLNFGRLLSGFGMASITHVTRLATKVLSSAFPRRRALCTSWNKPR